MGGVDVGLVAGAGQRHVAALLGGVLEDKQMRGVGGLALGGERVLGVGQADARLIDLLLAHFTHWVLERPRPRTNWCWLKDA